MKLKMMSPKNSEPWGATSRSASRRVRHGAGSGLSLFGGAEGTGRENQKHARSQVSSTSYLVKHAGGCMDAPKDLVRVQWLE